MFARLLHGLLGFTALTGCLLSLWNGWHTVGTTNDGLRPVFPAGWQNMLNQMVFFTFMSNVLVAVSSLQLAWSTRWKDTWHVPRIAGLICIVITGVVFNLLLDDGGRQGLDVVINAIVHIAVPIAAPLVWLIVGPRETTFRRVLLAALIPIVWLVATMTRGVLTGWYPYSIIDVGARGWLGAGAMVGAIVVVFFVLGAAMVGVDTQFRRGRRR